MQEPRPALRTAQRRIAGPGIEKKRARRFGQIGGLQDLADGVLEGHADAVLAASIFHYGQHTVGEAKALMAARGVPVRI